MEFRTVEFLKRGWFTVVSESVDGAGDPLPSSDSSAGWDIGDMINQWELRHRSSTQAV